MIVDRLRQPIKKEEKQMKKWQITLIAVGGFLLVAFFVGFIFCNVIY